MSHSLSSLTVLILIVAISLGCEPAAMVKNSGPNSSKNNPPSLRPNVRMEILKRLQNQTQDQQLETLVAIIRGGDNEQKKIRYDALEYLSSLGTEASSIGTPLAEQLLVESDSSIVLKLQHTLAEIKTDVEDFLVTAAATANEQLMSRIVKTLGFIGAKKPESIEFLNTRLSVNLNRDQLEVCKSLTKIGPPAHTALPKLIEIAGRGRVSLKEKQDGGRSYRESRDLYEEAINAIAAIGPNEQAIPVLTSALAGDPLTAQVAADALATLGPRAASALPELEKLKQINDYGGKAVAQSQAIKAAERAILAIKPNGN